MPGRLLPTVPAPPVEIAKELGGFETEVDVVPKRFDAPLVEFPNVKVGVVLVAADDTAGNENGEEADGRVRELVACFVGDLTGLRSIPASPVDSRGGVLGRAGSSNTDMVPFALEVIEAPGGCGARCSLAPNVNAGATEVEETLAPNIVGGVPKLIGATPFRVSLFDPNENGLATTASAGRASDLLPDPVVAAVVEEPKAKTGAAFVVSDTG